MTKADALRFKFELELENIRREWARVQDYFEAHPNLSYTPGRSNLEYLQDEQTGCVSSKKRASERLP
jgi:hypothetical protein